MFLTENELVTPEEESRTQYTMDTSRFQHKERIKWAHDLC